MSTSTSSRGCCNKRSVSNEPGRLVRSEADVRAPSSSLSVNERHELLTALRRLCAKLYASQPIYDDEDVAIGPNLADTDILSSPPPQSPLDDADKENYDTTVDTNAPDEFAAIGGESTSRTSASEAARAGQKGAGRMDCLASVPSTSLFLTAVNLFEPRLLARNRRVSAEAVTLLRQGYALVWQLDSTRSTHGMQPSGGRSELYSSPACHEVTPQQHDAPHMHACWTRECLVCRLDTPETDEKGGCDAAPADGATELHVHTPLDVCRTSDNAWLTAHDQPPLLRQCRRSGAESNNVTHTPIMKRTRQGSPVPRAVRGGLAVTSHRITASSSSSSSRYHVWPNHTPPPLRRAVCM